MDMDRFVDQLSKEEAEQIENDINLGILQKKIRGRIDRLQPSQYVCAVCGGSVEQGFHLEFGPPDFRKRAFLCALDCLEYFIQHITGRTDQDPYY